MSDALDRAVDARLTTFSPDAVPPFETVEARRRSRDRRRRAAVAAALTAAAVLGGLSTLAVRGSGEQRLGVATRGNDAVEFAYHVRITQVQIDAGSHARAELDRCLALPGLSKGAVLFSAPPQYTGHVTGSAAAEAFRTCVEAVPGTSVTITPITDSAYARQHTCPDGPTSTYDPIAFLMVGDQMYAQVPNGTRGGPRLGAQLFTVTCRMTDGAPTPGYRLQGGDAALLPVGTPVHEVVAFDPAFRVAATYDGRTVLYEADRRDGARTGADVFPGLAGHVVAIRLLDVENAKTVLATEADPVQVRTMTAQLLSAPNTATASIAQRDVFLGLVLDDGTTVVRAYLSRAGVLAPRLVVPADFRRHVQRLLDGAR